MKLLSQNVQKLPPMLPGRVWADIQTTTRQAGARGVVLWQECDTPRHRRALRRLDRSQWATYYPGEFGVAISWRSDFWEFIRCGWTPLHPAVKGVCGPRIISWVILRHPETGLQHVFSDRHYVPGAWAKGWVWRREARQDAWDLGARNDAAFAIDMDHLPHAGGGDYNSVQWRPTMPDGTRWHQETPGVDWLFTTPTGQDFQEHLGGREWYVLQARTLRGRYSDHHGRMIQATTRAAR